ncbi:hypothetical protein SPI_08209 [Niveomyces insectorum RCEF 264]|uniref:Conserved oligomeric Golgi complex subunit 2 n=1 Tax=Niveomyces insectorum RCEF 264 TaxID=1081102 RepID=A0A162IDC3_9HYPO|nr:hypothetical protein SPI_08209 [Niveomyces insectorum RCEF 264]
MVPPDFHSALPRRATSPYTPYSPYAAFHLPSSSSSESGRGEDDDDADLPFPTALSRKDFLAPAFDPIAYLSSLFPSEDGSTSAQRHQTLEDLRTELRERSSAVSTELLELVNANYTSFLGLGDELKGGDDNVEDVRVALFGFRRSIEDVQNRVKERRLAVSAACRDLDEVRLSTDMGRRLLELDERVAQLEEQLVVANSSRGGGIHSHSNGSPGLVAEIWGIDEADDEDDNEVMSDQFKDSYVGSSSKKLMTLARDLVSAGQLANSVGFQVPFVRKIDERLIKCKSTLLLDLNTAVNNVRKAGKSQRGQSRLLSLLAIYRVLDSDEEAVRILQGKAK